MYHFYSCTELSLEFYQWLINDASGDASELELGGMERGAELYDIDAAHMGL